MFITVAVSLLAQLLPLSFSLDPSDAVFVPFRMDEAVFIPGGASPFEEGEPALPGVTYSLVIPQGTALSDVTVEILHETAIPGIHSIVPVCAVPLGESIPVSLCRTDIYQGRQFPSCQVQNINTGSKTGFRVASFCFVPLRWNMENGEIALVTEAVLTPVLEQQTTSEVCLSSTQVAVASRALESIVCNPEMITRCAPLSGGSRGTPWIVIADEQHHETLQPLIDYRNTTHGAAFVSTQWIYEHCDGRDTQEQIRNFLKDAYENHGLVYALIVGDFGETTRLSSLNISGTVMGTVADLYFCDLDGSWDLNGNSQFGELGDGVDYFSDIYVGRFSTDVPARLQTMVEKTIAYETSSPDGEWRTTALLAGAGLWVDDPPGYWGSFVCDSIDTRIPDSWTVHKLYEDYSSHPDNQIELYNQGVSYSSLNGHGNPGGVWWFYGPSTEMVTTSNYYNMSNDGMPVVFHSMACHPGHLQNIACIAERLMFWPHGGGIAVMFNSHWGIGTPPGFGPSEWLELFFAEVLLQDEQYEVGVAHGVSKDRFKANVSITHQRWILQENNFLGDPAVRFAAGQMGVYEGSESSEASSSVLHPPLPNPASEECVLSFSIGEQGWAEISIHDLSGRVALTVFSGVLSGGEGTVAADLSRLPSGCYRVVMCTPGEIVSEPLLVIR